MKFNLKQFQKSLSPADETSEQGGVPPEAEEESQDQPQEPDDLAGLKSALQKERAAKKDAEKELKGLRQQIEAIQEQFKSISPEEYAKLQALQKQAEERAKQDNKIRAQIEANYQQTLAQKEAEIAAIRQEAEEMKVRTLAEKAYFTAGGSTSGDENFNDFDLFYAAVRKQINLSESGRNLEIVDSLGVRRYSKIETNQLMTPIEFFNECKTSPTLGKFFPARTNTRGSGMPPNAGYGSNPTGRSTEGMTRAQKLDYLRNQQRR